MTCNQPFFYVQTTVIVSQTGFVPKCGTVVNIVRAIERIKMRTTAGRNCYGLFVDLKSAYNPVVHSILFKTLESTLQKEEIELIKAVWSRSRIFFWQRELYAE